MLHHVDSLVIHVIKCYFPTAIALSNRHAATAPVIPVVKPRRIKRASERQ
jgi:hypothetical protein